MAETICVSSPTLTSTRVTTSHSLSTTTRVSVTTLPGSTLTSVYSTCAVSPNTTTCLTSTTLIPQGGVTSTQIVTLTSTVDVPVTALATLYGSSCRTVSSTTHDTPSSTDPTPTETPTTTSTITTTSYSTFTGTSVVTSDGTTFTSYYTSVSSTIPVSSSSDGVSYSTTSTSTTSTGAGLTADPLQTNTPAPGNNTGAIVGGTLGGIAALGLLALLTWHMIKKSHRFDNLFKDEDTNYYGPPPKNPPFNPYQYGLVAQQDTQPMGFSPPHSPGQQHANLVNEMGILNNAAANDTVLHANSSTPLGIGSSGNEVGMQGGSTGNDVAYNAPNQTPVHHARNPSTIPLLVGMSSAVSGHTRPNTGSSRASVSSSDPLGPLITHATPNQTTGYPPPQQYNSYPPALAMYAQQHGHGQPPVQPQQNLGHSMSLGSSATFLTSAAGSSSDTNAANPLPVGAGSVLRRPTNTSQPPQIMPSQRYEDPFARTGSPVTSYQNQPQVLRVRNAEPTDGMVEGSSSRTFGTPGLSMSGQTTPSVDGKGRPLNLGGEKALLVHLDGGAYQEQPRTPAPPAYMEL